MSGITNSTLFFGGSFDPPHLGHMNLLAHAIAAVQPQRVLVVPSGTAPHKAASATPAPLRMEMCRCFQPLHPALVVSDMEVCREGKSYTYDSLEALRAQHPETPLFLALGGDMLASFTQWYRWRDVLALATLVAAGRGTETEEALQTAAEGLRQAGGHVVWAPGEVLVVSSTQVRAAVKRGDGISTLVPPLVEAIIRREGLYR